MLNVYIIITVYTELMKSIIFFALHNYTINISVFYYLIKTTNSYVRVICIEYRL